MTAWTDATKIFDPIENKNIQALYVSTMIAENPLFESYYDPSDIKIEGARASVVFSGLPKEGPKRWKRGFSRADWPFSETWEEPMELVEYGLFGDMSSQDFGKLAFEAPATLDKVMDAKIEGVAQQWKRAIENRITYRMCNKENYAADSWEEFEKGYFEISADPKKTLDNQAKALDVIARIKNKAYEALDYSTKFNKAGREIVTRSLKNFDLLMHYKVNTFLSVYGYSQAFNVGYLELKQMFRKVIIKKLPDWKVGDIAYSYVDNKGAVKEVKAEADKHAFNWRILLCEDRAYRIHDAINHPGNYDVFIDFKDYNIDLTSYIGKWWFAFEAFVKSVNSFAWIEKA